MMYKEVKEYENNGTLFKIGYQFIIEKKPENWNSYLNGNCPLDLNHTKFPYKGIILQMSCDNYSYVSMTDGHYGWSLSGLIESHNIKILPNYKQMRKDKLNQIEKIELTKEYIKILEFLDCQILDDKYIKCNKKVLKNLEIDLFQYADIKDPQWKLIYKLVDIKDITDIFHFKTSWSHIMPVIIKIMSTKNAEQLQLADVTLSLNRLDKQELYTSIIKFINQNE